MNDDRPGRRLTTRKKAVFAAATLTAAFLLAEVTVRATRSHTDLWALTGRALGPDPKASWADVDAFCAYRARPGRYTGYGGNEKVKSVNSDGYISTPEVSLQKSPGTIRLAFLGESSCAGTGSIRARACKPGRSCRRWWRAASIPSARWCSIPRA